MATTTNGEGHFKKARAVEPLTITQMTQVIIQIYSIMSLNCHLNRIAQIHLQALEYLIKTDKEFVTKLHRAYVDSLNDQLHQ